MYTKRASVDDVVVKVQLTKPKGLVEGHCLSQKAWYPGMDSNGDIWFSYAEGGCWRVNGDGKAVNIGGAGAAVWKAELGEANIEDIRVSIEDWCEIENGVFWGITPGIPTAIVQIDTTKPLKPVSPILIGMGEHGPGKDGFLDGDAPAATVNFPRGPLLRCNTVEGSAVFFYDNYKLRSVNLSSQMVTTISRLCPPPGGVLHHPSLLRHSTQNLQNNGFPLNSQSQNTSLASEKPIFLPENLIWCSNSSTRILDLQTGASASLYENPLHPLLTIAPFLTIAVEEKDSKASIVLVDWELSDELKYAQNIQTSDIPKYNISKERVKVLQALPGEYGKGCIHRFLFHKNQLCAYSSLTDTLALYANLLSVTSTTTNGFHIVYPLPPVAEFRPNLTQLLASDCPLPFDLQLTHNASNSTWNVHYDILKHHEGLKTEEEVQRLATVFKNSTLPLSSLDLFVSILYFAPVVVQSTPEESFMPVCHCIQLCNQIGMDENLTNHLLWQLETQIVPKLSNDFLLQQILTLWFIEQDPSSENVATYSKTSYLMNMLASRCRKFIIESEIDDALEKFDFSQISLSWSQLAKLSSSIATFISPSSSSNLLEYKPNISAPSIASQQLKWDSNLSVASRTPPENKYEYVFSIEGMKTGGIVCNALLLYPQWKWFERLTKTKNCVEVQTRHVVMPATFTPTCLLAILSVPHGTYCKSDTVRSLSTFDLSVVCKFSEQLQLPENSRLAEFSRECHEILLSSINDDTCIDMLNTFSKAGISFSSPLFVYTLDMIYQRQKYVTLEELLKLPTRLRLILCAYADDKGNTKNKKFSSLTTGIEGCFMPE